MLARKKLSRRDRCEAECAMAMFDCHNRNEGNDRAQRQCNEKHRECYERCKKRYPRGPAEEIGLY